MDLVYARCAGLDVHKVTVVGCVRVPGPAPGERQAETQTFATTLRGLQALAAWLAWRVGLDPGAARERVRVARALGTLPRLGAALGRGEISYAKVRAVTRVATPETEERLLAVARAGTAEHVERIVRGWRRVDRRAELRET